MDLKSRLILAWTAFCTLMAVTSCRVQTEPAAMIKPRRIVPVIRHIAREEQPESRPPEVEVDNDALPPMTEQELAELIAELKRLREKEEHPAVPSHPPMTEREMALEDSGVWFDVEAFKSAMPENWKPEQPLARRVQYELLTIDNCPPCDEQGKELQPLEDNGWSKSSDTDAHIRLLKVDADDSDGIAADRNVSEFPTMILLVDGVEQRRFTGVTKRAVLVEAFTAAVQNLRPLTKAAKPPPFMAGEKKITKEQLDLLLNILGENGPAVLPNSVIVINQQGIKFTIPAKVKGNNTVTGNIRRFVFDQNSKPFGEWSFLKASADAITVDAQNYTATVELPGMLPDTTIKMLKE